MNTDPLPAAKPSRLAAASWPLGIASAALSLIAAIALLLLIARRWSPWTLIEFAWALSLFFALPAIILGSIAAILIKRSQGRLTGAKQAAWGFRAGCCGLLLTLFALLVLADFVPARTVANKNACINNLRQIDGAKEQWALENKKTPTDTPTWTDLIGTDKYIKVMPDCDRRGTYTINNMATKPTCSISDHTFP